VKSLPGQTFVIIGIAGVQCQAGASLPLLVTPGTPEFAPGKQKRNRRFSIVAGPRAAASSAIHATTRR
jgi:hypothetical protein